MKYIEASEKFREAWVDFKSAFILTTVHNWDWLMVRVWAFVHIKEYRKRLIKSLFFFIITLMYFYSISRLVVQ